jgi:hypothetical protein
MSRSIPHLPPSASIVCSGTALHLQWHNTHIKFHKNQPTSSKVQMHTYIHLTSTQILPIRKESWLKILQHIQTAHAKTK